ncbi:MAG: hypothetical protein M3P11_05075 [Actinomycetota bacterium]|nr:hypothetical protein [Actinomycetota bacterium]
MLRELLDALTRSEADRAALIGRLYQRDDARWLAELLTDLEADELARLQLVKGCGGCFSRELAARVAAKVRATDWQKK